MSHIFRQLKGVAAVVGLVVACSASDSVAQVAPELPRAWVDTDPVVPTGRTLTVAAGGNLQAAVDAAVAGDVILVQAGAQFTGPLRLRNKAGSGWITIRTSAADSQLPQPGERITPAYASVLPKLVTTGAWAALETDAGAHHYRFVGIEFAVAPGVATNYGIITLGQGTETSVSQLPHHIVFDRVYVHGQRTGNVRRGIALNAAWSAVIDSHISDIHEVGADSQAICVWNGPGPFKIVNNYLEAAGENILVGGADPRIPNLVPSDIEVRQNTMFKPLSWKVGHSTYAGTAWTVKNIFELKNAQRVLVEGNHLQHNWLAAQNGFSVLFTVRNQEGTAPWSVVQDVTFSSNLVQSVAAGINILGWDDIHSSLQTRRIRIANNLFVDVNNSTWGGNGRLLQVLDGAADITVEHNTALQSGDFLVGSGRATAGFVFRNNLVASGPYGMGGDGTYGNPAATLSTYFPNAVFTHNVIVGASGSGYPSGNYFPASFDAVGFVSTATGDYMLSSTSPFKAAASDGTDIGVNFSSFFTAFAVAVPAAPGGGGTGGGAADTTAPVVSVTTPADGATVSGAVSLSAAASDNVGVVGVRFLVDGAPSGSELSSPPYSVTWDSSSVTEGTHTIRAEARDAAGNVGLSPAMTVTVSRTAGPAAPAGPTGQPVSWVRLRNAVAMSGSLEKTSGCDGCQDAGASSAQAIASGAGSLQFVVGATTTQYAVGLSVGDADTSEQDIDFAIKVWPGGTADVRLNGKYQNAEVRIASGDVLSVAVASPNLVTFSKNGVAFHQLRKKLSYPLVADVSLSTARGQVLDTRLTGGSGGVAPSLEAVTWTEVFNLDTTGSTVTKVGGCDGCPDAGAVSRQVIASGTGFVEFRAADTFGQRVIGLSTGNSGTAESDIDFALKFWPGGGVDVRENGAYVGVDTTYATTDVFRIAVSQGVVSYLKNGVTLHRSTRAPSGSLVIDTSFSTLRTGLGTVMVSGAQ